jgi:transaldolase
MDKKASTSVTLVFAQAQRIVFRLKKADASTEAVAFFVVRLLVILLFLFLQSEMVIG